VDETKHTITVFCCKKYKNIFRIFLGHFGTILDIFWCQNRLFWPIFNIKLELWSYFSSKVDETKHTITVFCCKKYKNIFRIFWGHFGPILDQFWCQNRLFWPIFNNKWELWSYFSSEMDETKHTITVFHCKNMKIFSEFSRAIFGLF
jgi:hypothetical protein